MPSPLRVLHAPWNIGANPQGLAEAERELGLASTAIALEQGPFAYTSDEILFKPGDRLPLREAKRLALLWRALKDFDVIHFNFGRSLMPVRYSLFGPSRSKLANRLAFTAGDLYTRLIQMRDVPILKRAGKGICVTFQGDDARQGGFCREHFAISLAQEVGSDYYTPEGDAGKRQVIDLWERYADRIYALNPDLLHVLPARARFMAYASVDPRHWQPSYNQHEVPVVLHAPSHRGAKGTRSILEAVDRLKAEGVPFEFVLVENMPHAEARRQYERADLLVDQLLAGWYGGLGIELMALGKPVMCYIREPDLAYLPEAMRAQLPIINVNPATVYDVLKEWLTTRRGELSERGRESRAYMEAWHDPLRIASGLRDDYQAIMAGKA